MGDLEGFFFGNCYGEAIGRSDGFLVVHSTKGCRLVHQTGPGSWNMWVGWLMGLGGGRMLRGVEINSVGSCARICLR